MTNDQISMANNVSAFGGRYINIAKRYINWLLVIGLLVMTTCGGLGCARTVTQIVDYGSQLVVDVTLSGTVDTNSNRYFMVLSSNKNFQMPLPQPDNPSYYEMIEPGTQPKVGSLETYYTNFYSTWSGYIRLDPGGYFAVPGPFVQGQTATSEFISTPSVVNNRLSFVFNLSQVFGATVPDTIYFDVVTVPWPSDSQKLPADHINSTNAYISKIKGSATKVTDLTDATAPPAALDIISCEVTVQ